MTQQAGEYRVTGFAAPLQWINSPLEASVEGDTSLRIRAGEKTDLFNDPASDDANANAPMLLGAPPEGDFILEASLTADLQSIYDAAALVIYSSSGAWAKFALELSPLEQPTIVTVVTNGRSDDANSIVLNTPAARLRVARIGDTVAFHVLLEDQTWYLARYFAVPAVDGSPLQVGFLAQSPTGQELTASFDGISLVAGTLEDIRSGV